MERARIRLTQRLADETNASRHGGPWGYAMALPAHISTPAGWINVPYRDRPSERHADKSTPATAGTAPHAVSHHHVSHYHVSHCQRRGNKNCRPKDTFGPLIRRSPAGRRCH